jgi:Flp pilus assembly protein TadD
VELRKKDPYYHAFLADDAIGEGNWGEAQAEIEMAIKLQPYDPEFFLTQARILLQLGDVDGAARNLEAARRWAIPAERERFDSKLAALKRLPG